MDGLSQREMEELFSFIIGAYFRDKVDIQIRNDGINVIVKEDTPGPKEMFVALPENGERDPRYPEEE